jgi:hypothetical protein
MLPRYCVLQNAQRRTVDMRYFRNLHPRAVSRIEHPPRNLNEHRIEWRLGMLAEIRHIGPGPLPRVSEWCSHTSDVTDKRAAWAQT